jgi:hypothetical protein
MNLPYHNTEEIKIWTMDPRNRDFPSTASIHPSLPIPTPEKEKEKGKKEPTPNP